MKQKSQRAFKKGLRRVRYGEEKMMRNFCIWGSVRKWQRHESWWHLWASRHHVEKALAKINLCWCSNILEDVDSLVTEEGWQQQRPLLRDQENASVGNCDTVLCQRGSHIIGDYFIKEHRLYLVFLLFLIWLVNYFWHDLWKYYIEGAFLSQVSLGIKNKKLIRIAPF